MIISNAIGNRSKIGFEKGRLNGKKDPRMDRVEVGMHVDIKRSDGRVHSAVVTELRTNAVMVEWFEKDETKGKEIDIVTLLKTNTTLARAPPVQPVPAAVPIRKTLSSRQFLDSDEDNDENETSLYDFKPPASYGRAQAAATVVPKPPATRRSMAPPTSIPAAPGKLKAPSNVKRLSTVASAPAMQQPESSDLDSTIQLAETRSVKGSTVQKIEKIDQEREERRIQQERLKRQRELEKEIDPGNPNYKVLCMIRDFQTTIDFRPLKMSDSVTSERIMVCIRKRPMSKKEMSRKEVEVITIPNRDHLFLHMPQTKVDMTKYLDNQKFRFDYTFDENASNEMVYKFTTQPLVRTVFEQGFATCFAYGQTGSGKTHTMGGDFQQGKKQNSGNGIYALAAHDVFNLKNTEFRNLGLSVYCSFFEIYGSKAFDLLNNKALLRVLEDGKKEVNVVGLKEEAVDCEEDVLDVIRRGSEQRTAGATSANSNSSRSHAVFQIIVKKGAGRAQKLWGKFSLIDLAGNERGQDTGNADRQTRTEGAEINKSLLALKECIRGMAVNNNHVPFRSSKLTMILRDSFVGERAKLCMIAMISPGMSSCEHTLNTLRYAKRVKELGSEDACTPLDDEDLKIRPESDEEERDLSLICSRNGTDKREYERMRITDQIAKAELETLNIQNKMDNIYKSKWPELKSRSNQVDYDQDVFAADAMKFSKDLISLTTRYQESLQKWQDLMATEADLSAKNGYTKKM